MTLARKIFLSSLILTSATLAERAAAGEIHPGYGIGYEAKLIFDKSDTKPGAAPVSLHSGQTFSTPGDGGNVTAIRTTASMAWCDPVINPDGAAPGTCYGWSHNSRWFLIDLSRLKKQGLGSVWVTLDLKRYDSGPADDKDSKGNPQENDDLIPALTVWRGNQNRGPHVHWYPAEHQETPEFWGWLLQRTPFVKTLPMDCFASAYATPMQDLATVHGKFKLRGGNQDYLTVAVGGDAKDPNSKHPVHYELVVDVKKKHSHGM
jgi:hypothetical protein